MLYVEYMKLIVGLGNPGKEYEKTRHNVGFMMIDQVREALDFPEFRLQKKFNAAVSEGTRDDEKIILVKPNTFMNASGQAVQALIHFYKSAPEELIVIFDDIDLPVGTMRYRPSGSAGTHNGMRSIIEKIGFSNFPRIRLGIESRGDTAPKEQDLTSFVLSPFAKQEKEKLKTAFRAAFDVLFVSRKFPASFTFNS